MRSISLIKIYSYFNIYLCVGILGCLCTCVSDSWNSSKSYSMLKLSHKSNYGHHMADLRKPNRTILPREKHPSLLPAKFNFFVLEKLYIIRSCFRHGSSINVSKHYLPLIWRVCKNSHLRIRILALDLNNYPKISEEKRTRFENPGTLVCCYVMEFFTKLCIFSQESIISF